MKIQDQLRILKLAFAGLPMQRARTQPDDLRVLCDFQNEIAEHFKKHLPEPNRIEADETAFALKVLTHKISKNPFDAKVQTEVDACLDRQTNLATSFIPEDKQDA